MNPDPTQPVDIVGLLNGIAGIYPPVTKYIPALMLYFTLWCGLCAAITSMVTPPTTASPTWWLKLYSFLSIFAARWGHGLPAVVPGMSQGAAAVMRESAKVTAANPASATVTVAASDVRRAHGYQPAGGAVTPELIALRVMCGV